MSIDVNAIQEDLKSILNEHRYRHILGVQYTSICLAMRYGYDLKKAELAGLLHDCAKHMNGQDLIKICKENHICITAAEYQSPYLLHGKVGAHFANVKYGVEDKDILSAITVHTTGKPNMTMLEKIVFTADYIEPERHHAPNLDMLRKLSFENIDEAIYEILKQTLAYLHESMSNIDVQTITTYNYYKEILRRNDNE